MKRNLQRILLGLIVLVVIVPLNAINKAPDIQDQDLLHIIRDISNRYDVHFTYDREIVENVKIDDYDPEAYNNIDEALESVLKDTKLKYVTLEMQYVIIYRDDEQGMESLEKMVGVLQKIIAQKKSGRVVPVTNRLENQNSLNQVRLQKHRMVINISGQVRDQAGEPLIGVNVLVKGTNQGTSTDFDGNFTLEDVDEQAVLVVSYIGYQTQEIPVAGKSNITISLLEDSQTLDEVVVVGYGTQKKVNLTGAVSSISSEELTKRPSYSVGTLIQGRAPGLQIIQQSGEPGNEKLKIAIRGKGTFSGAGSNPLVVIDGIPYPSWTGLNNLNPENVESINILRDAASASIYGARAANGVILVTTKKGTIGDPRITYNGNVGFQEATFIPDFITNSAEYMEMYNYTVDRQGTGTKFSDELIEAYKNAEPDDPQYPNFDWRDALFNPGWGQNHSLSINGGTDNTRYYVEGGYYSQNAILRGQSYDRFNIQFNLDTKVNDWISFGTNMNGIIGEKLGPAMTTQTLMQFAYDMNPTTSPRLPNGTWSVGAVGPPYYTTNNIWRLTETGGDGGTRLNENHNITVNGYVNVDILDNLRWNITGSYSYAGNFEKVHQINPADENEYYFQTGEFGRVYYNYNPGLANSERRSAIPVFQSTLNYSKTIFEKHSLTALLGFSQESYHTRYLSGHRRDYAFANLPEIDAGDPSVQELSGNSSEWALQSFFGRLGYNYEGKYLLEANARYDGSSRIQKDNRWGLFPSVSFGWRISEENFLKSNRWIDNLKLRGSWGQLGNQEIGTYPYQSLLNTTNYAQGDGIEQGILLSNLSDPNLKWEITTISNIGLDLDIRNGLFSFSLDLYNKDTEGILNRATIPNSIGLSPPTINFGSMNNRGIEMIFSHRNNIGDLNYSFDLNFSHNKNKITKLISPSYGLQANQVGYEFGAHYMVEWIGIFQSQEEIDGSPVHPNNPLPGDLKFKDQNSDGVIDADDRIFFPGRYPKFLYGGNVNLNWRNFDFSFFIQGVSGTKHYISRRGEWPFIRMAPPTTEWRNAWTPDNPTNEMPALYAWPYAPIWSTPNSYFLKNTSYVRLKNIQLGYTIPKDLSSRINLNETRIYFSADNLITYSPYTTNDPERDEDIQYGGQTEAASYPNVKTFTLGIRLNIQ